MDFIPSKSSSSRSGVSSPASRTDEQSHCSTPFPSFVILHSTNDTVLAKLSPFFVEKALQGITSGIKNIRKMRSGDLLVETTTKHSSQLLLNAKNLGHVPISVTPHHTLNTSRGVISCSELTHMTEDELKEEFSPQGIIQVRRISIRKDGKQIPTKHLVLTFHTSQLPSSVRVGYLQCTVRPYVPNPVRCYNCQKFGHSSRVCRGKSICPKCSLPSHGTEACCGPIKCGNCSGDHPSYSRTCRRWQEEKSICTIMANKSISYSEAKKQVSPNNQPTYASVTKTNLTKNKPTTVSVGTQTDVSCHPSNTFTISLATVTKEKKSVSSQGTNTDHSEKETIEHCNPPRCKEQSGNIGPKKSPPTVTKQKLVAKPSQKPLHKIIRPPTGENTPTNGKENDEMHHQRNDTPRKETLRKKSPDPN